MNNFKRINIAIKPSEEASALALELSREVSKYHDVFFILGDRYLPHMTVYSPELPEHNIEKMMEMVENFAKDAKKVEGTFSGYSEQRGFAFLDFDSEGLKDLHKKIVELVNPLREPEPREERESNRLSEEEKRNIAEYGHPYVMSLYNPHITLTRVRDFREGPEAIANLKEVNLDTTVDNISLFEMGPNGTCTKLIKEFKLA